MDARLVRDQWRPVADVDADDDGLWMARWECDNLPDCAPAKAPRRAAPMVITFPVFSAKHPVGGVMALYEFANGMKRLGHEVHLVHIGLQGAGIESIGDMEWVRLEEGIHHVFPSGSQRKTRLPDADFIFWYDDKIPRRNGLPLIFIQGYGAFSKMMDQAYRSPCPKICTATWLVDVGKQLGVPGQQLVYAPCGLKHEKYRLVSPIENRPFHVAMVHSNRPWKGARFGLAALGRVKRRLPGLKVIVFGTQDPERPIPRWMRFLKSPDQSVIVNEIYNKCRVFVMPSIVEGFGLPCIEAMACGSAVVTTFNGGSKDYAIHGETALVSEPRDVGAMANHIEKLLVDDPYRVALARRGHDYVRRFSWDESARTLEAFLKAYAESPEYYQRAAG
jgi:glycosyltransferase involved in cell wall biosynthesis